MHGESAEEGGSKRQTREIRERNSSLAKGDVARRNVQQINSHFFKCVQHSPDFRPSRLELLPLLGLPVGPNLCRKFGALLEVCAREIEDEWRFHDCHLQHPEAVVRTNQLRYVKPKNSDYPRTLEPLINAPLSLVGLGPAKRFNRDFRGLHLAFCDRYDTVFSRA